MTPADLERRLETRMENCEDALSKWPDSVAWLARYHELGEVRALVQQLGPEAVLDQLSAEDVAGAIKETLAEIPKPKGGTLHGVLIYSHKKANEWGNEALTTEQLEGICVNFQVLKGKEGFLPPVSKYGLVEELRVTEDGQGLEADVQLFAPFAVQTVGVELHLGSRPYITKDGGKLEPVLRGVHAKGIELQNGLGALVSSWAMLIEPVDLGYGQEPGPGPAVAQDPPEAPVTAPDQDPPQDPPDQANALPAPQQPPAAPEMGRLALRRKVLQLIEEGPKRYTELLELTGQPPEAVDHAISMLCKSQKIEEYKSKKDGKSRYRIKDMHPVVRARKQAERKRSGDRKREEYKGGPDGSTARSWAINLRKHILAYLKTHPNGASVGELTCYLRGKVVTAKAEDKHVQEQLENLLKRKVVVAEETSPKPGYREHIWKTSSNEPRQTKGDSGT